jgi:hypothetical protein
MKICRMIAILLWLVILCPGQERKENPVKIVVRLLNGKTNKPIWLYDATNVGLGDGQLFLRRTGSKGEFAIDISDVRPFEIRVSPSDHFDCRFNRDVSSGILVRYSLEEIISRGVVGENLCGKARLSPEPGVLVIYVRPRTFIELLMM